MAPNIEATHRDEQHWYLVVLVKPILDRADRDGLPCQLETSDPANVAFYQRFGFEVIDPAFPAIPGGPTLTTMRRPQGAHLT